MDSLVSSVYNFMTSTVVPVVTEQAGNLATGAQMLAEGASTAIASVGQWSSGSEDATASAEVFSWEQRPEDRLAELQRQQQAAKKKEESDDKQQEEQQQPSSEASSPNTSIEWDVVKEDVLAREHAEQNKFVMVQSGYEWAKNWK